MSDTIYKFGTPQTTHGNMDMSALLGGKGANLAEMSTLGIPVPHGITIPTTVCREYREYGDKLDFITTLVDGHVLPALKDIYEELGHWPLWSVRSGAQDSMPGMMETILNVGMTSETVDFWKEHLGELAANDCHRRLILMYSRTVLGWDGSGLEGMLNALGNKKYGMSEAPGSKAAAMKSPIHMQKLVDNYHSYFKKTTGEAFPDTLRDQMIGCIRAVFDSWDCERAIEYREMHNIPHDLGTAINIQMMVYGNMNENSCSGVAFTRDPATGENKLMGEWLQNCQGEDVVAGTATPLPISLMNSKYLGELNEIAVELESHYGDMLDLEFTVEDGKLWMLQCRVGKRTAKAAFRIAHDMVQDGLISEKEAVSRVSLKQYMALKGVRIDLPSDEIPEADYTGIAAGGGLVTGHVVTTAEQAKKYGPKQPVILVTNETTPEDFGGMAASVGILTRTGGATSHAAVVGRSLEKHCVVGCTDLPISIEDHTQKITICGATGRVWLKELPLTEGDVPDEAKEVVRWAANNAEGLVMKHLPGDKFSKKSYVMTADCTPDVLMKTLKEAAATDEIEEIYIDLRSKGEEKLDSDSTLWNLVGKADEHNEVVEAESKLKTLIQFNSFDMALKAKAVLVLSKHHDYEDRINLRSRDWKLVERVENLEDLIDSDGIVDLESGFATAVGGEHVAEKLFALMADAGKKVRRRPKAVSPNRLVFEVLK